MYAYVPFLDMINHADEPNAAYKYDPDGFVELIAMKDIKQKEQVSISYSGKEGDTNKKLMQKYGFVKQGGNWADRIHFEFEGNQFTGSKLSLTRFQKYLGDFIFKDAMTGSNLYMFSAIRSFPMGDDPDADWPLSKEEVLFAKELLNQIVDQLVVCKTEVSEDKSLVEILKKQSSKPDERVRAALAYRIERKMLLTAGKSLLELYIKKCESELNEIESK
eukprot:TRINITY_DN17146_c0_g1_i6.p2 TRINITY_DN17146_c0_g1~~TRINITY_DN17146_c0_g1_i6.p2  ORF type:complete len:219 (-),score=27.47 TRINITY_DN17146_c0_g1_i6:192-848(-)